MDQTRFGQIVIGTIYIHKFKSTFSFEISKIFSSPKMGVAEDPVIIIDIIIY